MKPKKRTVTILDVARNTGVSASTVSRVLTGNIPVASETEAIVRAAIHHLGYRPNQNARGLVTGNSMVIGVLTQDIASSFFGVMLEGIERGLEGSGYSPMIIPGSWRADKASHAIDIMLERQVDALILLSGDISDERIKELSDELPLVVVDRHVSGIEHC